MRSPIKGSTKVALSLIRMVIFVIVLGVLIHQQNVRDLPYGGYCDNTTSECATLDPPGE